MGMYSVKIIYKNEVETGITIFEESVLMIKADSFDEAYRKAEKYTEEMMEKEYVNMFGQKVYQSVERFADCFEIIEEDDYTEVYSSYKMNKSPLPQEDYVNLLTDQCSKEELMQLRSL